MKKNQNSAGLLLSLTFVFLFHFPKPVSAQNQIEIIPPSARVFLKKELTASPVPARTPNSYDLALRAQQKVDEAGRSLLFDNYKTKLIGGTMGFVKNTLLEAVPSPVTKAFFDELIDFSIEEWKEKTNEDSKLKFDEIVKSSFKEYSSDFLKYRPNASSAELSKHFSAYIKSDIVKPEDYSLIGKNIDLFVLDYISSDQSRFTAILEEVKSLQNETDQQIAQMGTQSQNAIAKVAENTKLTIQKEFIEIEFKQAKALGEMQESLNVFQEAIVGEVNKVYDRLDVYEIEIRANTATLNKNTKDLERYYSMMKNGFTLAQSQINDLYAKEQETRILVNENTYKINVMSDVLYGNVNTEGKIAMIRSGLVRMKDTAAEIRNLTTISNIEKLNRGLQIGSATLELAANLGIDKKHVDLGSKLIQGAAIAAQLYGAYATGNLLMGIQGINAAFDMFKKPKPDPMFEAIMKQFEIINQRLDIMDKKIDNINKRLDDLIRFEVEAQEENSRNFAILNQRFDILEQKTDIIYRLLSSKCNIMQNDTTFYSYLIRNTQSISSLDTLLIKYNSLAGLTDVLKCIHTNSISSTIDDKPFLLYGTYDNNKMQLGSFSPMLSLVKASREESNDFESKFLPSLAFLPEKTNSENKFYGKIKNSDSLNSALNSALRINTEHSDRLLSPEAVTQLADLLINFEPYLYFGSETEDFRPRKFSDFPTLQFAVINEGLEIRYRNLLRFCNTSLLQQNILSGGSLLPLFYQYLFQNTPVENDIEEKLKKSLKADNYYFKSNLSTYLLYSTIGENKVGFNKFQELYYRRDWDNRSVDTLLRQVNWLIGKQNAKIVIQKSGPNRQLLLQVKLPNSDVLVLLPIQPPQIIIKNEHIFPEAVSILMDTRDKLLEKVFEYDLMGRIKNDEALREYIHNNFIVNLTTN